MNVQNLRKILEETNDRLSIFASEEILKEYNLNENELLDLINDFLSNEEKLNLFNNTDFKHFPSSVKEQILYSLLKDKKLMEKNIINTGIEPIIKSSEEKEELIEYNIKRLISELKSDELKLEIIKLYQLSNYAYIEIKDDNTKIDILLKETISDKTCILAILKSLSPESLIRFLVQNKKYCDENDIHAFEIIRMLSPEEQKKFVEFNLENSNLTLNEKREILATLKEEVKEDIDTTNFPEEYKTAISMKAKDGKELKIDFGTLDLENLENYRGLDNLIHCFASKYASSEDEVARNNIMKLSEICPNMKLFYYLIMGRKCCKILYYYKRI